MSKSGITREKMGKTSAFPLSGRGSGGGGKLPYERGQDARRLALGVLISNFGLITAFWAKRNS